MHTVSARVGASTNDLFPSSTPPQIKGNTVVLGPFNPGQLLSPPRVSYAWEQWPQCSVYNGKGGCDDHEGIAGTPWCQGGKGAGCPVF